MSTPTAQLTLFDAGIDVATLRLVQEDLMGATKAPNTNKAYQHAWRQFERWAIQAGRKPLPASVEAVELYIAWMIQEGYRLDTIRVGLSAIRAKHGEGNAPIPIAESTRQLMRSAARKLKEQPRGKAPVTPEHLRAMCEELAKKETTIALRDKASILLGFAAAWRRSELVALQLSEVKVTAKGLQLWQRASKTDQEGKGRAVGIPFGKRKATCPVRAVEEWIQTRGRWQGPLFCHVEPSGAIQRKPIKGEALADRLKIAMQAIGEDPKRYAAHSLRAGFVTAAAEQGSSELSIMRRTGQKHISTVLRYVRPAQAFAGHDPIAGVL